MIEIELKARIHDVGSLIDCLDGWTRFKGCCHKNDTYWEAPQLQIRIREECRWPGLSSLLRPWPTEVMAVEAFSPEVFFLPGGRDENRLIVVTYKKKSMTDNLIEVNQEYEFQVDNRKSLECFLLDVGFRQKLKKEKLVASWEWEDVTLELCYLPELGNFLELEILHSHYESQKVDLAQAKLHQILERCGISREAIEPRFYYQLLDEAREHR